MAGLQIALEHIEKSLSCVSCGNLSQDLRTHAECGGAQCQSCWLVKHCPRCHETVSEESLWDLSHMMESNAQRVSSLVTSVDPFQFLTALRDVVQYEQGLKQTPAAEGRPKSPTEKLTSPQETFQEQQKLIARNNFGGMAYLGGDQSGKCNATGRVGRRRWQRQQEELRPAPQQQQDDFMFDFHSQSSMPLSEASVEASPEGPHLSNRSRGGESGSREKENDKDADNLKSPQSSQSSEPSSKQDSREQFKLTVHEETGETSATEVLFMMSESSHRNFMMLPPSSVQTSKRPQSGDKRFVTPASTSRKRPWKLPQSYELVPQPSSPANHSLQSAVGSLGQDLKVRPVSTDSSRTTISIPSEAVDASEKPTHERTEETVCIVTPAPRKSGEPESPQSIASRCIPDFQGLLSSPKSSPQSNSEGMNVSLMQNTDECSIATALLPATQDFLGLVGSQSETTRKEIAESNHSTSPNSKPQDTRAICLQRAREEECDHGSDGSTSWVNEQPSQQLPNTCDFRSLLVDDEMARNSEDTITASEQLEKEESSSVNRETQLSSKLEDTRGSRTQRSHEGECGQGSEGSMSLGAEQIDTPSQHLPDTCDFRSLLEERDEAKIPATVGDSEEVVRDEGAGGKHETQPKSKPAEKLTHCFQGSREQESVPESEGSTIFGIEQTSILSQQLPNTCDFRSLLGDKERAKSSEATVVASEQLEGGKRSEIRHGKQPNGTPTDTRVSCSPRSHEQECVQGSERSTILGTEQTDILSQLLPNTCDFHTLLPMGGSDMGVTMKARDGPPVPASTPALICLTLDDSLQGVDFDRVARLRKTCHCKAIENVSYATTHYVPFTKTEQDPFLTHRAASNTKSASVVCLATLNYYKALALGVSIVDRRWLEESEITGRWVDEEYHRVWGDSWLYRKVIELQNGSDQYLWLLQTPWWGKKCGPCQLPPASRLDDYCILVLEEEEQEHRRTPLEHVDETKHHGGDQDCFESIVRENGVATDRGYYQHLTKEQIETLCGLLGANVFDNEDQLASCEPALTRLVLVPASVPPNSFESIVKKKFLKAVLTDTRAITTIPKLNQVRALRSSWLTESLAARYNAPMEKYIYGVLILP